MLVLDFINVGNGDAILIQEHYVKICYLIVPCIA